MKSEWPADQVERRKVSTLVPYARNARTHSDEQVGQIAASIKEWGWTVPVLIEPDGGIIAGHGRVMAAQRLGIEDVPCMIADGWSEGQKRAYIIADNKLALNAGWDDALLAVEFKELGGLGFDLELTGFGLDELADLFDQPAEGNADAGLSENYSRKIEAPIYEITGACPAVMDMMDRGKAEVLQAEIESADLPEDVRGFLHYAAERHTVFNFRNIAEFYAHADARTQDLMERSALVIIDFDRAVEEGFVKLAQGMMEQVRGIKADAA